MANSTTNKGTRGANKTAKSQDVNERIDTIEETWEIVDFMEDYDLDILLKVYESRDNKYPYIPFVLLSDNGDRKKGDIFPVIFSKACAEEFDVQEGDEIDADYFDDKVIGLTVNGLTGEKILKVCQRGGGAQRATADFFRK